MIEDYDCDWFEKDRLEKLDVILECGGDDEDYPDPGSCPDCGGELVIASDPNYGADADGNRGIRVEWLECSVCGEIMEEE